MWMRILPRSNAHMARKPASTPTICKHEMHEMQKPNRENFYETIDIWMKFPGSTFTWKIGKNVVRMKRKVDKHMQYYSAWNIPC